MGRDGDDALLTAAAAGDGEAFAAFYRRHGDLVLSYLRRRVAEPEQAFDLAAETFAAALVSVRRYQPGRGPAAGWLLGIAHNKLLESLRRGRVEAAARRRLRLEPIAIEDADLLAVDERAAAGAAALERLLAGLPAEQQQAVRARVLDEREYAHLVGATTYAAWATFWPGASGPFAKPMNEIPKVVFSNSLASADWGETTIATGDLAAAVTRLKQERSDGYCSPTAGYGSPGRWSRPA